MDPGDAAGPPSPPVPPHSSWTQGAGPTAGGFDPHALMTPKRRIGPIVAGMLVDWGSFYLAFGVTGVITLLAVLPWLKARETHVVDRAVHPAPTP